MNNGNWLGTQTHAETDEWAWWQGRTRRAMLVICCPQCGDPEPKRLSSTGASSVAYWGCLKCKTRWKEASDYGPRTMRGN